MSDLVSRLLEAIAERERRAEAARGTYWDDDRDELRPAESVWIAELGFVRDQAGETIAACTWDDYDHTRMRDGVTEHIAENDPTTVLRLCQAHREIVDEYRQAKAAADADSSDISARIGAFAFSVVLDKLARGYGVEDGED